MSVFLSITELDGNVYIQTSVDLRSCRDMNIYHVYMAFIIFHTGVKVKSTGNDGLVI